jgi:uncharacterized protein
MNKLQINDNYSQPQLDRRIGAVSNYNLSILSWTDRNSHWLAPAKTALSISLSLGLILFTAISPGVAQDRKPARTLTASGRGIVTIPTTLSQIRLAIEAQGKTPNTTQQEAAKQSARVMAYLKTQKVDKLQTTGINLNPTYIYPPNGNPQLTGYTANNSISFQVPTDRAGALLDAAVENGATRIDGVSFVASDKAIESAQIKALKQATLDAQRQADAVLSTLNFQRKDVIGIKIDSTSTPAPISMPAETMQANSIRRPRARDGEPSTPVAGGEQQVEAAVTLDVSY